MWDAVIFDNSVRQYGISLAVLAIGLVVAWFASSMFKRAVLRSSLVRRTEVWVDKIVFPLVLLGVVYVAISRLQMPAPYRSMLDGAASILLTFIIVRAAARVASHAVTGYFERHADDQEINRLRPLRNLLVVLIWLIGFIFLLDNLGFDINAVVAGIGVSGIAVAIAAQGILGDLFNYFVIIVDKPFEVGDFIVFDDKMGSVKRIGVKTTRIHVPGGEELIVANSNLASSRIHNFKRMARRLVIFTFGVRHDTPVDVLESLPGHIESLISGLDQVTFDRCHFSGIDDSGFSFDTVYFIESGDYRLFMDTKQAVNLGVSRILEEANVPLAQPARSVTLTQPESRIEKT